MKGLQVTFRGKTPQIAPEFGENILVYQRNDYYHVSVGGLEIKSEDNIIAHYWIDTELQLGEYIEIEIKDIQTSSESSESRAAFTSSTPLTDREIKEMFQEKLNDFYVLEKLLKSEGLISSE